MLLNARSRLKEVIIRRLSLKNIIPHVEFEELNLENRFKLMLINRLNEDRFTRTADTLTYSRIQRI